MWCGSCGRQSTARAAFDGLDETGCRCLRALPLYYPRRNSEFVLTDGMGAASGALRSGDLDRLHCHECGTNWTAVAMGRGIVSWTCERCTLCNEPCASCCAACEMERLGAEDKSGLPGPCPMCGGDFVERLSAALALSRRQGEELCHVSHISTGSGAGEATSRSWRWSDFEVEKRLGQGAHGFAMLVRRTKDGQNMVAKQVVVEDLSEEGRIAAMREVDVMKTLHHPNIIKMHTSFFEEHLFIIMEYAPGGDLAVYLKEARKQGPLSQARVVSIATGVLAGLEHMHCRRLLHRDIKPANVLLSANGTTKLADFGVSRALLHTASQARTVVGTPLYMSPELLEENGYSYQSDIWAAGVLLYECLTYSHPFRGTNLPALVLDIMRGRPKPLPASTTARYSAAIHHLVSAMLHPAPQQRPSASECLALLAGAEDHSPAISIRRSFEGRRALENLISKIPAGSSQGHFPLQVPTPR